MTVAAIGLVVLIQLGLFGVAGGFVWRLLGGAFWKGFIFGAVVGQALFMGYETFFAGRLGRPKDDLGSEPPQPSIRSRLVTEAEARSPTASMSSEEDPTSGSADKAVLNLSSLEALLGELLHAYRSALMFVEGLPFIERRLVSTTPRLRGLHEQLRKRRPDQSSTHRRRRLVVRPLLRLFVQAHVRKQLLHIIRVLQIERLSLRGSDPPSKEFGGIIEDLVRGEGQLFGWSRIRAALSKAPLIPAALAFTLAVYQVATGIDLTSGAAFGRTAAESAQTIGWGGVARLLSILLYAGIFVLSWHRLQWRDSSGSVPCSWAVTSRPGTSGSPGHSSGCLAVPSSGLDSPRRTSMRRRTGCSNSWTSRSDQRYP